MDYVWYHDYPQIARESGFKMRQIKDGVLDWRLLGTVDIEKLIRDQCFERIDGIVTHLSEAPLGPILDSNVLDSGVAKYFNLAQLTIQYLLFCKKFLDETLTTIRNTLQALQTENIKLKKLNREGNDELLQLHKKLQRIEEINRVVYPCSFCTKNFISNDMLDNHIKRKHPKASEKSPAENDKNLISTIKLELEIKHLKERLNVAEKEIRDKPQSRTETTPKEMKLNENSNAPTVEVKTTVSVATQMDISTRSIGIQNNLEEPKEVDDEDDCDAKLQQNIIEELREKLSLFEDWKKREALDNERSVDEVKSKVDEMLNTVDTRLKQINETRNAVATSNPNEIKEMQKIFSENLIKICSESELKLNNAIRNFEAGYKNKLESLEGLIKRYGESSRRVPEQNVSIVKKFEKSKRVKKVPIVTANSDDESESELSQEKIITSSPVRSNLIQSATFDLSSANNSEESEEFDEDALTQRGVIEVKETEDVPSLMKNTSTPKIIRKKILSRKEEDVKKPPPTKEMLQETTWKIIRKRLDIFGINPKMKSISSDSKEQITKLLTERRNLYRKNAPTYFATRNKLKNLVENISKERLQNSVSSDESVDLPIGSKDSKPTSERSNEAADMKSISESDEAESSIDQPGPSTSKELPSERPNLDNFKLRLEKILASPIRKPLPVGLHTTPAQSEPNITAVQPGSASDLRKPIPAPRKKVMFDFDASSSSENEAETKMTKLLKNSDSDMSSASSL